MMLIFFVGSAPAQQGCRDAAFRWLDKAIDDREGLGSWLVWIKYDPVWKEMRKDSRFKEVEKRAGW